jgi:hypothetical protein
MQTIFHECSAHLVQSETAAKGVKYPTGCEEEMPYNAAAHMFEKPVGDRVGYEGVPASCRLPLVII